MFRLHANLIPNVTLFFLTCLASVASQSPNQITFAVRQNLAFANKSSTVRSYTGRPEIWCVTQCQTQAAATPACVAAQYEPSTGTCYLANGCAMLQLQSSNLSTKMYLSNSTISIILPATMSGPIFEWMMTDACGFTNTGSMFPGLVMQPMLYGGAWDNIPYTPSLNSRLGNAVLYPGIVNYMSMASISGGYKVDLTINSLTLFEYFWLNASPNEFTLFEFGELSSVYGGVLYFWYFGGGIHYNFQNIGCTGACYVTTAYTQPLRSWTHVALTYSVQSKNFTVFLNGTQIQQGSASFSVPTRTPNTISTAGRPARTILSGTTFCLKIFQAALTAEQIQYVALSCLARN